MAAAAAAPAPAVTAPPAASAPINTATLVTPARCTADFSLVPVSIDYAGHLINEYEWG
jgi:hypothetical protein